MEEFSSKKKIMTAWPTQILPHGVLKQVSQSLWYVHGRLPHGSLARTMAIYRLNTGELLIHSAIAMHEEGMRALEALGQPHIMIVPNRFHRLDAAAYKARYPNIRVVCPQAALKHVARKVHVDATAEIALPQYGLICHQPPGIKPSELVYEVPLSSGGRALLITDLLMNLENQSGVGGWFLRAIGSTGFFGMTAIGRLLFLKDRHSFKAWLTQQSARDDLRAIVVAHGEPILENVADALRDAAARL